MEKLYRFNQSVKKWLLLSCSLLFLSVSLPSYAGYIVGSSSVSCGGTGGYSFYSFDFNYYCTTINWTVSRPDGTTGYYFGPSIAATMGNSPGTAYISASGWCDSYMGGFPKFETGSYVVSVGGGSPPTPGTISGTTHRCNNASATYSISAVSGAATYTWQVPSGWRINGGGTQLTTSSRSVSVTAPSSGSGTGYVRVRANSGGGCGGSSVNRSKTVYYGPQYPRINGPGTVGTFTDVYYSATGRGISSWSWSVPSGWLTYGGTSSSTLGASTGSTSTSGWLSVSVNTCGTTRSDAIYVTVSNDGGCNPYIANGQIIEPCLADYRAGEALPDGVQIEVYPNPVAQLATVQVQVGQRIQRVQVYNQLQQLVLDSSPESQQAMLDFTRFDNGLYFIKVNSGEQEFTRRIVVQH